MSNTIVLPEIGSVEFWRLYDEFCQPAHLKSFIEDSESPLTSQMSAIMISTHKAKTIHSISRPERGWKNNKAWLALRPAPIRNVKGHPFTHMRTGDVIIWQWGWDRDVIVTHNPISEHVCGYLLGGPWPEMVGLFMPLFDKKTIMECIKLRTAENVKDAIKQAEEDATLWHWY